MLLGLGQIFFLSCKVPFGVLGWNKQYGVQSRVIYCLRILSSLALGQHFNLCPPPPTPGDHRRPLLSVTAGMLAHVLELGNGESPMLELGVSIFCSNPRTKGEN